MVHLLAELIQNATSFSAVDMPVEVAGQLLNSGGVLISITDRGVGMSVQEISHANWRLENPPPVDIDVPKWIGLLVVSRLAARRGVRVRLQHAELGGLAALVWIPDELVARQDTVVRPEFTRPGPDGPRRGAHEPAMDLRGADAQRSMAATRVAEPTASREEVRSTPLGRRLISEEGPPPEPARPSAGSEPVPQEVPVLAADAGHIRHDRQWATDASAQRGIGTAQLASPLLAPAAPAQQETRSGDSGVIVPAAVNPAEERRLPIFEAVESSWFKRRSPGPRFGPHRRQGRGPMVLAGRRGLACGADGRIAGRRIPDGGRASEAAAEREPGPGHHSGRATRRPRRAVRPADIRDRLAGFQRGVTEGRAAASEAGKPAGETSPDLCGPGGSAPGMTSRGSTAGAAWRLAAPFASARRGRPTAGGRRQAAATASSADLTGADHPW